MVDDERPTAQSEAGMALEEAEQIGISSRLLLGDWCANVFLHNPRVTVDRTATVTLQPCLLLQGTEKVYSKNHETRSV